MKALLDACVLYPTVLREILLSVAQEGLYQPLWSDRILEEWARATRKLGPVAEMDARADVALVRAAWPKSSVAPAPGLEARLHLPDENDIHVLAAAIAGNADLLVTFNAGDFPRRSLREEGIERLDPDQFLMRLFEAQPDAVARAVDRVVAVARRLSGEDLPLRPLLKRAGLRRLGKALEARSLPGG
jgi:predicted nucleic acid-binding protein